MSIKSYTNAAPGPRAINRKVGEVDRDGKKVGVYEPVTLLVGQTMDLDGVDDGGPVFKALVEAGEIVVGKAGTVPESPEARRVREAAEAAEALQAMEARATAAEAAEAAAYKRGFEEGRGKPKDAAAPAYERG